MKNSISRLSSRKKIFLTRTILLSLLIVFSFLWLTAVSFAAEDPAVIQAMKNEIDSGRSILPGGDGDTEAVAIKIIGGVINMFLSLFGIIFLTLMIYSGYKWMMARGSEEELKKAKDIIKGAIIGLIIVILAFAITYFISAGLQATYTSTAT